MIPSRGFLRNTSGHVGKKVITDLAIPLARDNLPRLASNLASNAINNSAKEVMKGKISSQNR